MTRAPCFDNVKPTLMMRIVGNPAVLPESVTPVTASSRRPLAPAAALGLVWLLAVFRNQFLTFIDIPAQEQAGAQGERTH
jgi:hypothetical protein